jgi:hypothetical protein
MKGTTYGKGLPRGTQVKKVWEPLLYGILYAVAWGSYDMALHDEASRRTLN